MASTTSGFVFKAAERFYYSDYYSLYGQVFSKHMAKEQYFALRHVAYVTGGLMALINFNFPFSPSFPTIGMCPSGWKGTFVCEPDKTKALEMYKAYKAGKKTEVSVSISH